MENEDDTFTREDIIIGFWLGGFPAIYFILMLITHMALGWFLPIIFQIWIGFVLYILLRKPGAFSFAIITFFCSLPIVFVLYTYILPSLMNQ